MKLYIAHVGYYEPEIGIYELHTNFHVVAAARAAKEIIKNKDIFKNKKMHIDGIQEVTHIDGYDIQPVKNNNQIVNQSFGYDDVKALS